MSDNVIVGITHGDINGVGYELIINTFQDARMLEVCTPVIYGSSKVLAYYRKVLNAGNITLNNINEAKEVVHGRVNLINCVDDNVKVELGKSTKPAGEAAFKALELAVADAKDRNIDVLVTCPINKENIQSESFTFPGHTEYLQESFAEKDSLMFMVSEDLRVGVVTGHIPVKQISQDITAEKVERKLQLMNQSLIEDFGIRKPRIAVMGLNPHAGDNGVIGTEDKELLTPLLERLRDKGILAMGPYPADGFFGTSDYKKFDAVLAMYHDQGLIPFKVIAMENGVNFTAGLPVVRTSPAHGTAYNIAGKGVADIQSFREAIYTAIDVHKNRLRFDQATRNPLRKQHVVDSTKVRDISLQELEKEVGEENMED